MSDDLNILIDPELVEVISVGNNATPVTVEISDFVSFTTDYFVTQSISAHNVSLSAHQDIRNDFLNKVDKVPSAVSGNIVSFSLSGNIYDSTIPLSSLLVLDNLGQIDQMRYLPSIYLKNKTPSLTAYCHEVWIETNEFEEDYIVVGPKILINSL